MTQNGLLSWPKPKTPLRPAERLLLFQNLQAIAFPTFFEATNPAIRVTGNLTAKIPAAVSP